VVTKAGFLGRATKMLAIAAGAAPSAAAAQPGLQDSPRMAPPEERTIVVTGTRLSRPEEAAPSPTQVARPEDFTLTGTPNVEQTLNQLPQLVGGFTNTSNNPGTGAATLDLRGLGSVRTLVLVNGRRWIASDAGEVPEVDVNTISAALIERVDIVTGGASAVYGSDAVTGVINFVLRSRLDGLHAAARQSITGRGDGRSSSADLSFGAELFDDRLSLVASVGWLDQRPIQQDARALSRVALGDGCVVPGTRQPTGASTAVNDPTCAAPNVFGLIAGGSGIIPGGRILGRAFFPVTGGSLLTSNAAGVRFDPDGSPRPFISATDLYNFAPSNYLQVPLDRWSANLLARFEASPAAEPFVELSYIRTRSPQQLAPVPGVIGGGAGPVKVARINLANPFLTADAMRVLDLSYGIDAGGRRGFLGSPAAGFRLNPAYSGDADGIIALQLPLQTRLDLGPRQRDNRRDAWRILLGIRGEIGAGWSYDAYYSRSRAEHDVAYVNGGSATRLQQALLAVRDPATGQAVCIDRSNGCIPANIFGAGNLSAEAAAFIRTDPGDVTIVEEEVAEASLRGELLLFAAGPAGIAVGTSWRRTAYAFTPDAALFTGDELGFQPGKAAAGRARVWELFAETRIPLLADRPLARDLALEFGARWSRYDTVGSTGTFKVLGLWEPVRGLRLRGGYQRAVRAPNVRELFEAEVTRGSGGGFDPCAAFSGLAAEPGVAAACIRNGVPAELVGTDLFGAPTETTRGNPDLEAETAHTLTVGAILTLRWPANLTVTVDYYDIRIDRAIGVFGGGSSFLVAGCIFAGADPADPLCAAYRRSADGAIASYDLPTANLAQVRARGIDWQVGWRLPLGGAHRLDLRLSGTRYLENGFRANPGVPFVDCAGYFGQTCGNTIRGTATPAWKLYNGVTWTFPGLSLALRHRWFSATQDSRIAFRAAFGQPQTALPEEGRRLEARHYFDLAATFELGERFTLTLGVTNLTDADAAITGFNQVQANTDPSLYDVLGRRFFATVATRF
jgi:iron complex outermembrane receptor protein